MVTEACKAENINAENINAEKDGNDTPLPPFEADQTSDTPGFETTRQPPLAVANKMQGYRYQPGDRPLPGYTIQAVAGRGGFGEVYFAVSDAGREVALKAILGHEQIELRGIAQCMNLKSPHLVSIFDVLYNDQGQAFVLMEYIAGPSLRQVMDDHPEGLGTAKAAFFLREIGKGLSHLHDCGIVHRDLKPANIFYEDGRVKIGDYGLSKAMSASVNQSHTVTVGSVHYMAPEVGAGKYDRSIDVYALGCLLYEMLTGVTPYLGQSPAEVLMKHLSGGPDLTGIEQPFARVIEKAMAKDPADRYPTVQAMVEDVFGAEHIQNSVSHFNDADLSVHAQRLLAKGFADGQDAASPTPNMQSNNQASPQPAVRHDAFNPNTAPADDQPSFAYSMGRTLSPLLRQSEDQIPRFPRFAMAAMVWLVFGGLVLSTGGTWLWMAAPIVLCALLNKQIKKYKKDLSVTRSQARANACGLVVLVVGFHQHLTGNASVFIESWVLGLFVVALLWALPAALVDWHAMVHPNRPKRLTLTPVLKLYVASLGVLLVGGLFLEMAFRVPMRTIAMVLEDALYLPALAFVLQLAMPWLAAKKRIVTDPREGPARDYFGTGFAETPASTAPEQPQAVSNAERAPATVDAAGQMQTPEHGMDNVSSGQVSGSSNTPGVEGNPNASRCSRLVGLLLAVLPPIFGLPICGLHRFYAGRIGSGFVWLFTFGFLGIGQLIDLVLIAAGEFKDAKGKPMTDWRVGGKAVAAADNKQPAQDPSVYRVHGSGVWSCVFSAAGAVLLLVGLLAGGLIAFNIPQAVSAGVLGADLAQLGQRAFGYAEWGQLVKMGLLALSAVSCLAGALMVVWGRRDHGLKHLLRGLLGGVAMVTAVACLLVDPPSGVRASDLTLSMRQKVATHIEENKLSNQQIDRNRVVVPNDFDPVEIDGLVLPRWVPMDTLLTVAGQEVSEKSEWLGVQLLLEWGLVRSGTPREPMVCFALLFVFGVVVLAVPAKRRLG